MSSQLETVGKAADTYLVRATTDPEPEIKQLDDQHRAWNEYMGNNLSFAPIEDPKTILELGSGTGAWTLQAAATYPTARITAADIAPLPPRDFPPNVQYKAADFYQPFPFAEGSFDVVHTRMVLIHVSHPRDVLERMLCLTRPGGWFLVEDNSFNPEPSLYGADIDKLHRPWLDVAVGEKNQDAQIGGKLAGYIRETGLFDIVEEKKVMVTRGKAVEDPAEQRFGEFNRMRFKDALQIVNRNLKAAGKDVPDVDFDEVWDDEDGSAFVWNHFVWAHRKTA